MEKILLRNIDAPDSHTLASYRARGGYTALEKVLREMTPEKLIDEIKASGLRGRGGAGFPTGMKWGFVPKDNPKPKYVVCNADESEPGTFKDRLLIEKDPHAIVEGTIIAAYAIRSHTSFIYIRGEMFYGAQVLQRAIDEAAAAGYLGKNVLGSGYDIDLILHRGAGAYICGEETGLLSSLEGGKGWPKLKPPFPATHGLFGCPTVVNNVETLAALPWIITEGAARYAAIGTEKSKGTKLYSVCGHIKKPGVYEVDMGYPFKKFLEEDCGGMANGKKLKGVIPGGASMPVLRVDELDGITMDYESFQAAGTLLGSGGVIVMDDSTCMVRAAWNLARFFAHESCGQCSPCREGCHWIEKILNRIEHGAGKPGDLEKILSVSGNIGGNTICPFGDAASWPPAAFIKKFRGEFDEHIAAGKCTIH
ncbi:MAG TPA: NADH-quinone oxidoreductase subunit NuoF [Candidatus Binatia bacterium]|nr:NADH-quinone oxidoreductase subunit NuoF [Candidatus Binatia bacterium]